MSVPKVHDVNLLSTQSILNKVLYKVSDVTMGRFISSAITKSQLPSCSIRETDILKKSVEIAVEGIQRLASPEDIVICGRYPAYLAGTVPDFDFVDVFINTKMSFLHFYPSRIFQSYDVKNGGPGVTLYHLLTPYVTWKEVKIELCDFKLESLQATLGKARFTFITTSRWSFARPSVEP